MSTETQCLEYARECARRAKLVTDPKLRERLFNISRRWAERATREPFSSAESQRNSPELAAGMGRAGEALDDVLAAFAEVTEED